jgi:hypothetical protein
MVFGNERPDGWTSDQNRSGEFFQNRRKWIAARDPMSSVQWKIAGGLVLAAPFVLFVVLLVLSPAAAGTFAGSLLGRIADPPVLIGIVLSGVAGALGFRWYWALGIGVTVGTAGCLLGYAWWTKVAGSTVAQQTAARFVMWAMLLAAYGYILGRTFHRPAADDLKRSTQ